MRKGRASRSTLARVLLAAKFFMSFSRIVGLALLASILFAPPLAAQSPSIVDLGTLGGDRSEAMAINASGQVVGSSTLASGATRAFLYTRGTMVDLGTLPGGTASEAAGISDQGHVVGTSGINAYGPQFREARQGFVWQGGAMQSVGAIFCPCTYNRRYGSSEVRAIDASGQVVGDSGTSRGETVRHAFTWRDGAMQDLSPAGSAVSRALAINEAGQIVGSIDGRATLWQGGDARDLGTLPGDASSAAHGINAAGHAVGVSSGSAQARAVLWRAGGVQDLGALPGDQNSQANAINGHGQIVGWSRAADGSSRAVLWQNGAAIDLNGLVPDGSGWVLTSANDINDAGQIVGAGVRDGHVRAFLLSLGSPVAALRRP